MTPASMNQPVPSVLTGTAETTKLAALSRDELIAKWQTTYGIDIQAYWEAGPEIGLYRCHSTGLRFYRPASAAGPAQLYQDLAKNAWYYIEEKWEHTVAARDLKANGRVLEVGCGQGSFSQLAWRASANYQGIEINDDAVQKAQALGRPVTNADVGQFVRTHPASFDAVCCFQVLEHIAEPREFIQSLVTLLAPGGKLILSVPNGDSVLGGDTSNLLDKPPHHMAHWNRRSFESLTRLFPLQICHFRNEPLARYHVGWYCGLQAAARREKGAGFLVRQFWRRIMPCVLRAVPWSRRWITGHTLYVVFQKR